MRLRKNGRKRKSCLPALHSGHGPPGFGGNLGYIEAMDFWAGLGGSIREFDVEPLV